MFHYIGYPEKAEQTWAYQFNETILKELKSLDVPFTSWPNGRWREEQANELKHTEAKETDVWFVAHPFHPAMRWIQSKKGIKMTRIAGTAANPYEIGVIYNQTNQKLEESHLSKFDLILTHSKWAHCLVISAYPNLAGRFALVGRPTDFSALTKYKNIPKQKNWIAFSQRFSYDKLFVIEMETTRRLREKGFQIFHLISDQMYHSLHPSLLKWAKLHHIQFLVNKNRDEYLTRLSQAEILITTSISDMLPMSLFEAIYLDVIPVAPQMMCFPEFIHPDNLYPPFDIDFMIKLAEKKPIRHHPISFHEKKAVIQRILHELEKRFGIKTSRR
ncbi:hypothetical protein L1765_04810 [Microaerobacter geothermalis]|uniref:glycosyltransferase n=1 Tax=Microaerobacter geothermalis TaxID=674972 RepID=UPI001F285AB4|nr:glycosyltransferase [Microaerobacter geothermalis]MCF6093316.1 hypothetical protein [Microaerobacter geothermalis]